MNYDEYYEACSETNRRLRKCGDLLRKGDRSEAILLAQTEPDLLDMVSVLDFPERGAWLELLKLQSLAPPPELLFEIALELNQAMAEELGEKG